MSIKDALLRSRIQDWVVGGGCSLAVIVLAASEGYSPQVYKDPIGKETYCYGETTNPDPSRVYSKEFCQYLLSKRASQFIREVREAVPESVFLTPYELAAWGSFTYNVGMTNFRHSTAYRLLRQGRRRAACRQLPRWVYAGDKKLQGLVERRQVEQELCLSGASSNGK